MTHETESPAFGSGPAPAPPPAPPDGPLAPRRLYRSRRDRVFGGVCGGLAEYFGVDAVLLRIVAVALALSGGAGFLLYLIAWIAIPEETAQQAGMRAEAPHVVTAQDEAARARARATTVTFAGGALVVAGALMLLNHAVPWVNAALVWPLVVVAAGVAILASGRRRS